MYTYVRAGCWRWRFANAEVQGRKSAGRIHCEIGKSLRNSLIRRRMAEGYGPGAVNGIPSSKIKRLKAEAKRRESDVRSRKSERWGF